MRRLAGFSLRGARPGSRALRAAGLGGVLTAGAILLGPTACDEEAGSTSTDLRLAILKSWTEQIILPAHHTLSTRTAALRDASARFCATPDAEGLMATRAAWDSARGAFDAISVFKFGPLVDYPARLGPNLNFWPARTETIDGLLAGDAALTAEALPGLGAPARGLPAVEYLLFGPSATDAAAFSAGDSGGGDSGGGDSGAGPNRRCAYLVAATADAASLAAALDLAWSPEGGGFGDELSDPEGKGLSLTSIQEALSEVVNRMLFALDDMRGEKLGKPLGTDAPSPTSVESRFSGRSVQNLRDVLGMIELLYHGSAAEGALGLDDDPRLIERPDVTERFDAALVVARMRLDEVPGSLETAVVDAPEKVAAVVEALRGVQVVLQTDVRALLSLNAAFNDADGD